MSRRSSAKITTAKKCTKKCDARAKLLFDVVEPNTFLTTFSVPSRRPSMKSLITNMADDQVDLT